MNTVEEDKVSLNHIEIEGALLLELLEGVSTHASKDKDLRSLYAVQIEGDGGDLIARATDRYRLIEGAVRYGEGAVRYGEGGLDTPIISLDDVKKIITLCKAHKNNLVQLARRDEILTVSSLGDAITFTLIDANYPPMQDLLSNSEGDPVSVGSMAFNPAFMADYAKIAGKGNAIKIYFTGENKPMRVRITGDKITWRALLMPMRYTD